MTFGELLIHVGKLAKARGITLIRWDWDLEDWSPTAPNGGDCWSGYACAGNTIEIKVPASSNGLAVLEFIAKRLEADDAHR